MAEEQAPDLTKRLPRGAIPSPRYELAAAAPHVPDPSIAVPPSFLMWPTEMSSWNNYTYGDCVTAEEAFAKATAAPQTFIPEATVVAWASAHGYLNGATLTAVMTTMQAHGFPFNNKTYDDGPYLAVNWANAAILNSAIYSHGLVENRRRGGGLPIESPRLGHAGDKRLGDVQLSEEPTGGSLRQPLRLRDDLGGIGRSVPSA